MLVPNSAAVEALAQEGGFPALVLPDGRKVERPNWEWAKHRLRWRFLLDSYEGGEKYRQAVYDYDLHGMPVRNLIRHKREYPLPFDPGYSPQVGRPSGTDPASSASDDDYELRRARTPIPTFTGEAIGEHLSKIYNQEIRRDGPEPLLGWWKDVDGLGSSIDQWMADVAAPLLMVFGMLDFLVEHPATPDGEDVRTRADELRLGLDKCVVSYILPDNLPWWKVDRRDRYVECIVTEHGDDGGCRWRYWDAAAWTLYDEKGKAVETRPHGYGRVPIVRCYDKRRPSCRRVGMPRYEAIAEIQREYYNRDSELILSDTTQACPLLQGPEDYIRPDSSVSVGPGYVLPMKKDVSSGSYQGWEYVDPPKGAADSIRTNKSDLRDNADRAACLTKPAGAAGVTGQTVGQSGISKRLDQSTGNDLLGKIAKTLQKTEETIAEMAASVLGVATEPDEDGDGGIEVQYPGQFDLYDADELMAITQNFELLLSQIGDAPITELALLSRVVRLALPGMDDDKYDEMDEELEELLQQRQKARAQQREATPPAPGAADPDASTESTEDPAGEAAPGDPTQGE